MAFWNELSTEPLRQFRWYVNFSQISDAIFALKKCDRPKMKINTVQHKYLNHFYNFPGRVEWEDINLTFAAVQGLSNKLYTAMTMAGYLYPGSEQDRTTISKNNLVNQSGASGLELIMVGPEGTQLEKWTITNPLFTSLQFGSLDYGSEEIVEITCVIKYDTAKVL